MLLGYIFIQPCSSCLHFNHGYQILWLCLFFQAQDNFQIYYIIIFKMCPSLQLGT